MSNCATFQKSATDHLNTAIATLNSVDGAIIASALASGVPFGNAAVLSIFFSGLADDMTKAIEELEGPNDSMKSALGHLRRCSSNIGCQSLVDVTNAQLTACVTKFKALRDTLRDQAGAAPVMFFFAPLSFIIAAAVAGAALANAKSAATVTQAVMGITGQFCVDGARFHGRLASGESEADDWVKFLADIGALRPETESA